MMLADGMRAAVTKKEFGTSIRQLAESYTLFPQGRNVTRLRLWRLVVSFDRNSHLTSATNKAAHLRVAFRDMPQSMSVSGQSRHIERASANEYSRNYRMIGLSSHGFAAPSAYEKALYASRKDSEWWYILRVVDA